MENNKLCKLCFNSNREIINIFDENGVKLNIAQILKKHFWFKVVENDGVSSNVICTECWLNTEHFNRFYNNAEIAHNKFIKIVKNRLFNKIADGTDGAAADCDVNLLMETIDNENIVNNVIKVESFNTDMYFDAINSNESVYVSSPNQSSSFHENIPKEISQICPIIDEGKTIIEPDLDSFAIDSFLNDDYNQSSDEDFDEIISTESESIKKKKNKLKKRKSTNKVDRLLPKRKYIKRNKSKSNINIPSENDNKADEITTNVLEKKNQIDKEDAHIRDFFKMECDLCNCKFYTFLEARSHYHDKHKIKGYLSCCKRKFFRRAIILEHITKHLNPEAYKCKFCNKIYSDNTALKNHISTHSPTIEQPYKCDICERSFSKQFQLTHHKKYRHFTEADKKFSCDECGKGFISKCYLTSHIRGVHEFAFAQICDICAKVFKSKPVLENHRQSHFNNEVKPRLQCYICGVWLKHKKSLRTHIARHKDSVHTCPKCGKDTPNRDSLRNHLKYVHAERLHICNLCNKSFKKPIELKEHMASHTGEVLYTCPHCPKTFNSGANMHSHRKKIHPIEWHENRGQRTIPLPNIL